MKGKSDFWWAYKASNVDSEWKKARVRGVFVVFWGFVDFHSVPKTSCQKDLVKGMGLRCPKGDFKVGAFESKPGGVGGVVLS